jgi:phosphatidylglycerophosphatase A
MLKPPPIRSLEKLPEGTGIVGDDLGAGVYAAIVLQLLLRTGILS